MPPLIDLTDRAFGRLTVIDQGPHAGGDVGPNGRLVPPRVRWWCLCDPRRGGCGAEVLVEGAHLRKGETASCGCYRVDVARGCDPLPGRPATGLVNPADWEPVGHTCGECGLVFIGRLTAKFCSAACVRSYRTKYERGRRANAE
jgi:hypothetical protein